MKKSEILKEMKKIELKRKIQELENKKNVLMEENNEYIKQHLDIAEEELRKIAYENEENSINNSTHFVDLKKISISYISDERKLAGYKHKNKTLEIDEKYLIQCKSKEGINLEMIETLQHELIHYYCDENLDEVKLFCSADSSPIFHSVITFFNTKGLKLKTNGNLDVLYKEYQKNLYKLSSQEKITFKELVVELTKWQAKLKDKTNIIQEPVSYWAYDGTDNNYDLSEYRDIEVSEDFKIKMFQLGMDCNLENFEELINRIE